MGRLIPINNYGKRLDKLMPATTGNLDMLVSLHKKICKLYFSIEYNKAIWEAKAYVQPLSENRCAWEHFCEAVEAQTTAPDLSAAEMKKAHEHMLRCYMEYSEFRYIQIKKYAQRITRWASKDAIKEAMKDYFDIVIPLFDTVDDLFNKAKAVPEEKLRERVEFIDQANIHCETILGKLNESALKMLRRKDRTNLLLGVFKYVGIAALSVLGTLLVQYLLRLSA